MKILSLSKLNEQGDHRRFAQIVAEGYMLTDWICEDYPDHHKHYWTKCVPGIFTGEREIKVCVEGDKVVGIVVLKRSSQEAKICTLYVSDLYRGKGYATKLLEESFKWLGTDKPLITFADYKIEMLLPIIKKYGWKHTQTLLRGYYNDHSQEWVFNGRI